MNDVYLTQKMEICLFKAIWRIGNLTVLTKCWFLNFLAICMVFTQNEKV